MIYCLRFAVILFAVFLLSACGSVRMGRDFDVGVFAARIEQGATTQSQVRTWLGDPASVGISLASDGKRYDEWDYYYAEGELQDMSKARVKILQIRFDRQGRVSSYNWSVSRH
jgi:outer membrane protein assembly factor BamE (lipoprotein component of BamABCDE complex)